LTSALVLANMPQMSLISTYLSAIRRRDTLVLTVEPDAAPRERVFDLIAPGNADERGIDSSKSGTMAEATADDSERRPEGAAGGRSITPIEQADLSRLSIDSDGRLYWDGKPVEVRRRILMSRAQIIGASVIGAFVIVGALGAAVQGSLAARDWACRLGWTANYCAAGAARADIPT
jgi:hypothetical protein